MHQGQTRARSHRGWLREGAVYRLSSALVALAVMLLFDAPTATAAYDNLIGYPELQAQLGSGTPTGVGIAIQQVEAALANGSQAGNYAADPTHFDFSGKTFTNVTQDAGMAQSSLGSSNHARGVGFNLYGNTRSIAPGITSIESFEANHWLGYQVSGNSATADASGFLNTQQGGAVLPDTTSARIANHSWVGEFTSSSINSEVLRRLDFVVERDDMLNIVGVQNGSGGDRLLLKSAFNEISVGMTNAEHGAATLGVDSVYTAGRVAPTVVAPGLNVSNTATTTSLATPMVSAVTALLLETAQDGSLSNGSFTNRTRTIYHAEASEVIKAVLMAGADRAVDNVIGDDLTDYAIDTSNNLDLDFGAGQVNVFNSYNILAAGEHDSDQDLGDSVDIDSFGWDYDTHFGGESLSNDRGSYFFTAASSSDVLHATLAWNIDVSGFTSSETSTMLHDLNLVLFDVTNDQMITDLGASSLSSDQNTENVFYHGLLAGNRYELRVEAAAGQLQFDWDYALAWRIDSMSMNSVPEPSSVTISLLGALSVFALGRKYCRRLVDA
jgi:hypothetical protein